MRYIREYGLQIAFAMAVIATCSSLYISEIIHFIPCKLCWLQRICMYPLSMILGVAAYKNDKQVLKYALPLALLGLVIAGYHYTIQWFPQLEVTSCVMGSPCTDRDFDYLGFITIPFMSLLSFIIISLSLIIGTKQE
jgi:disulfide bond formation protein DsbB